MFLLLSVETLLSDILKLPFKTQVYEELSKITGRTTRQVSEYFRKKKVPPVPGMKIDYWLEDQGVDFLDDLPAGADTAVGWKSLVTVAGRKNSSSDFLPKTLALIGELAERDLTILRGYRVANPDNRFDLCKGHILKDFLPFFLDEPKESASKIEAVENVEQLEKYIPWLLFVSTLSLLAHAEAEYLLAYSQDQMSVLAKCLPVPEEHETSPSVLFFTRWLKTISLDKVSFVEEMLGYFGEVGVDEDSLEDERPLKNRDALVKQIQRYLSQGKKPKWSTFEQWTEGLYLQAVETQGRDEGHDAYGMHMKDIYGGVLILDMLYEEGGKFFQRETLLAIMATYQEFFDRHLIALKERVGT